MTCGIYKLYFNGTDKVYIGQSKNIEARFVYHKYHISHNKASYKLTEAFTNYGMPKLQILAECKECELLVLEQEAIEIYDSINNGFNTLHLGNTASTICGEEHHNAVNTNEEIIACLFLLTETPVISYKDISSITGVTYSAVCDIAKGDNHKWLKKEYPVEYSKMLSLKNNRNSITATTNTNYVVISPAGNEYIIDNIRKFAREHNLCQSHLGSVLKGALSQHKGWKLKNKDTADGCKRNCT